AWARLAESAVDSHAFTKGGDLFREFFFCFGLEAIDPELERVASGVEKARPFVGLEFVGEGDGRELSGVEDFVGGGIADSAENAWGGECAFEGAIFGGKRGAERSEVGGEDVDAARIKRTEAVITADDV